MPIPACSGDTLSGGLATTATTTSNVGAYAITQGTLAASANYTLSYIGANLTVTAAPLAVTADTQGDAFPNYVTSNEFFGMSSSATAATKTITTSRQGARSSQCHRRSRSPREENRKY
jgi:MBG domain (YGX type)